MSFDPMAAAIDWLDAYRSSDLELVLSMFADDAVVHCGCCAKTTLCGKESFRAYWTQRFQDCAASDLEGIQPSGSGTSIAYVTRAGTVAADVQFDRDGEIVFLRLGVPTAAPAIGIDFARQPAEVFPLMRD
jgi:ketosteroid isomerase-like protein